MKTHTLGGQETLARTEDEGGISRENMLSGVQRPVLCRKDIERSTKNLRKN